MHSHFTAVFDACVLYPSILRSVLIDLAQTGLFRARWTDQIHDEWLSNLLQQRPDLQPDALLRTRKFMDKAVPDSLVTGYEPLIPGLTLPDPDDRHVLAAALRCHAAVIVTFNLKDFPANTLEPLGVQAQHPDTFLSHLIDLSPGSVCSAIKASRTRLKNPPYTTARFLDALQQQTIVESTSRLREFENLL